MSDFEKWFEDQDFYTNMRFIHGDKLFDKDGDVYRVLPVHIAFESWFASACTSIDHIHRLQRERDQLKTQLNNMEACYIEKKKRVELLESNIKNLVVQLSNNYEVAENEYKKNADSYYSGKCDAFDLAEQLACLALRGDSDQHLTR
ncbi:hypothetical protein [Acinetobacter sp. YH12086]|uniref:hypothetical protein n=1 Tax=Acinetobacter sp. YH12086 TaxID=2601078 RepID=UPI0015D19957|nr:hypothetical protein [Acinetobacter sp. YH12086]